jgi:hypothetical protein
MPRQYQMLFVIVVVAIISLIIAYRKDSFTWMKDWRKVETALKYWFFGWGIALHVYWLHKIITNI